MSALRVLVADDEMIARKRLTRLLAAIENVEVAGECADVDAVVARVAEGGVDVVLLDIHMPGLTGIDALALLPSPDAGGPHVVFCTAHADYAIKAFDGGATDYLLKPVDLDRLGKAIERARSRLAASAPAASPVAQAAPAPQATAWQRLPISTKSGIVLDDPHQITHAVLDGVLVTVVLLSGEYVTDFTLQELEKKLPPEKFVRVHRRALLNLEHVAKLEPQDTGGYVAKTTRGHAVEISRQAARELRVRLGLRKGPAERDADAPADDED
ncbi:MAG: ypdB [Myxococcaceae bacterium]|nr:ypdB [Myxococcaceae bacterium]